MIFCQQAFKHAFWQPAVRARLGPGQTRHHTTCVEAEPSRAEPSRAEPCRAKPPTQKTPGRGCGGTTWSLPANTHTHTTATATGTDLAKYNARCQTCGMGGRAPGHSAGAPPAAASCSQLPASPPTLQQLTRFPRLSKEGGGGVAREGEGRTRVHAPSHSTAEPGLNSCSLAAFSHAASKLLA